MAKKGELLCPRSTQRLGHQAVRNLYGCRESLGDGIKRATDVMFAARSPWSPVRDVGKGIAQGASCAWRRVSSSPRSTPSARCQAAMEGYQVLTMDGPRPLARSSFTATGNVDVITGRHMQAIRTRPSSATSPLRFRDRDFLLDNNRKSSGRDQAAGRSLTSSPTARRSPCSRDGRLVTSAVRRDTPSFVMTLLFLHPGASQITLLTDRVSMEWEGLVLPRYWTRRSPPYHLPKLVGSSRSSPRSRLNTSASRPRGPSSRSTTGTDELRGASCAGCSGFAA